MRRLGNNKQCGCAMHTVKPKRDNFQINLKSSLSCFWLYEQHLVCYCSRSPCDPGGGDSVACWSQTLKALCKLLYLHSHRTHGQIHRFSYSESMCDNTLIYNNIILHKHKRSTYGRARDAYFELCPRTINQESNQFGFLPQ